MTELYFLGENLAVTGGPADDYISLTCTERYTDFGEFSAVLPARYFAAAVAARFLRVTGWERLGLVEKIAYDGERNRLTVAGRTAEALLSDRSIARLRTASGTLVDTVCGLVRAEAVDDATGRAIPHLVIGTSAPLTDGDGTVLTYSGTVGAESLSDAVWRILGTVGASYKLLPDYANGTLVFTVVRGLDRRRSQSVNSCAVFSSAFGAAGEVDFRSDTTDMRNCALVAGELGDTGRVYVTVDLRADSTVPLRELYVDARDLQSENEDGETVLTEEQYKARLRERGIKKLSERSTVTSLDCTAAVFTDGDTETGLRYGTDYALGDLCDIESEGTGLSWSERLSEVSFVTEGSLTRVCPRFGTAYPDLHTLLNR